MQKREGLHLANKLRSKHVEWQNQKMKVCIAAQTLSLSVANSLQFCLENAIEGFEEAEETIRFVSIIDRYINFTVKVLSN